MLIRICLGLLCLAAIAVAQNNETVPTAADDLETRFEGVQATEFRKRHFYCLGVDENINDLPPQTTTSSAENLELNFFWAIFLQYPVLSYLDSQRKRALFESIAEIVRRGSQEGGDTRLSGFSEDDFCVGNVTHYSVANYEESVLINIYFTGTTVFDPEVDIDDPLFSIEQFVSIEQFDDTFRAGFDVADETMVEPFEGRRAIVVDVPDPTGTLTETELNQHPGLLSVENFRNDPTRRAVLLGSYSSATTIEEALRNRTQFAFNPDPTNFGLEAGDIVFAVFGSLFLTAVGIMTLIGFFIHPFFFA